MRRVIAVIIVVIMFVSGCTVKIPDTPIAAETVQLLQHTNRMLLRLLHRHRSQLVHLQLFQLLLIPQLRRHLRHQHRFQQKYRLLRLSLLRHLSLLQHRYLILRQYYRMEIQLLTCFGI